MSYISTLNLQHPTASAAQGAQTGGAVDLGAGRMLPSPWLDFASTALPDSHKQVMWWAQYLWLVDGNYRTAMERVAAHFLTSLTFDDVSAEEEDTWRSVLTTHVDWVGRLTAAGHDFLCYDNSFSFLYLPFRRGLVCSSCGLDRPIGRTQYRLDMSEKSPYLTWQQTVPCPRCGSLHPFKLRDRRERDMSDVRVIQVPVDEVELAYNRFSDKYAYYWNFSPEDRSLLKSGIPIYVESTPVDVLEAVARGGRLEMNPDVFLHAKGQTISGVKSRGWGIPRSISNFRQAWLQQLVNKQEQAAAIDYTMGMRLLSPGLTAGGDDAMQMRGQQEFVRNMQGMVQRQRENPVNMFISPHPVNYQFMGGEGGSLVPFEKLKFRQQEYLNQLGVPLEFHSMTLSAQAAPMALRMFENFWQALPAMYNNMLQWMVGGIARVFGLKPIGVSLMPSSLAYDLERKQALLQLMAGQQVSPDTGLAPFGVNPAEEARKTMRHSRMMQRIYAEEEQDQMRQQELGALRGLTLQQTPAMIAQQREAEAQQQAAGGGGMPPAGAMPMGPGVGASTSSLGEMDEVALQEAQRLVSMPEYERKQELRMLRESNKPLHGLVRSYMEDIRSQARSEGGNMLIQQAAPQ